MTPNELVIGTFQTRLHDLLRRFQELKQENSALQAQVSKNAEDISVLRAKLTQADNDYKALKMAKMLEITDGDVESAKAKVAKLIRDVNKCIAILSDEQ